MNLLTEFEVFPRLSTALAFVRCAKGVCVSGTQYQLLAKITRHVRLSGTVSGHDASSRAKTVGLYPSKRARAEIRRCADSSQHAGTRRVMGCPYARAMGLDKSPQ